MTRIITDVTHDDTPSPPAAAAARSETRSVICWGSLITRGKSAGHCTARHDAITSDHALTRINTAILYITIARMLRSPSSGLLIFVHT